VNYHLSLWRIVVLSACFVCLSLRAAEYCLRPSKEDGTEASSLICCATPAGWQGWKDDPHYWDGVKGLNKALLEGEHRMRVDFREIGCKNSPDCPTLTLDTWGRDSRGRPDIDQGMRDFLRQIRQHQDVRHDPDLVVTRFGSFRTRNLGTLTVWKIRCSFWNDYLLTMITRRDMLLTIYLEGPDIKDIMSKLDKLEELACSARVSKAK
jgi:hypothetical protein